MKLSSILLTLGILFCVFAKAQEERYNEPSSTYDTLRQEVVKEKSSYNTNTKNNTYAEDDELTDAKKKFDLSKMRIGGNFGLQFGNYTFINLSPTFGYLFWKDRLELGAGPIFMFQSFKYNGYRYKTILGGADIYTRGYIWKGLFLQAQYDLINKESYYKPDTRINVSHFLLGGGFSTPISNIGVFYVNALINVIDGPESVYQGTFGDFPLILNIGFGFGMSGRNRQ